MTTNVETSTAAADPQARSARWARRFGWWFYVTVMVTAPFVLMLAAIVGVYVWWKLADMKAAHEVKLEVARIQALGEPVTILDLYAWHRVPEGTSDTTALWLAAFRLSGLINNAPTNYTQLPIVGQGERETLRADDPNSTLELANAFLKDNDRAIQAVLTAAAGQGECRVPFAFENGSAATMRSGPLFRQVARLMSLRTRVAVELGNSEMAVESIEANLALARAIEHEPTLVGQLARIAVVGVAMSDIEPALIDAKLSDAQLARLQANLQTLDIQHSLTAALVGERGVGYHEFHQFPPGPRIATAAQPMAGGRLTRPADCRFYLELMQDYIDASRQPFPKSITDTKQIAARVQTVARSTNPLERMRYALSMQVVPGTEAAFAASARAQAMRDVTLAAIAAQRYRLKQGEFPADLQSLGELLGTVPVDSYDGQPLRMIRKDGELVIYSIGQDGRDNGGQDPEDRNDPDIVVRLK